MAEKVVDKTMERINRVAPWTKEPNGFFVNASRPPGSDRILFHFKVADCTTNFSFHLEEMMHLDDEEIARELLMARRLAVKELARIADEG